MEIFYYIVKIVSKLFFIIKIRYEHATSIPMASEQ